MNANEIYTGEYYAWHPNRTKGSIPLGAAKVLVTRVKRVKQIYEKNRRTEVTIKIVEEGNSPYYKVDRELTVSSRELIDYWLAYKDEEAGLLLEQRRQNYERDKTRAKRVETSRLLEERLVERGLTNGNLHVSYGDTVSLSLNALMAWLHITNEEVEAAVVASVGPAPKVSLGYTTD